MSDQPITDRELDEIEVRAEVAAANLRKYLPPMQDMMDLIGSADGAPFGFGRYPVWTEPEPYVMDEAAKVIGKLVVEVRRLRAELQNAEPVKYGWWIPMWDEARGLRYGCSSCAMTYPEQEDYCPNCGAKMDTTRAEAEQEAAP